MAIILTNNAKFTPYTFEEMLRPLAMATLEYNAIEEGIAELGSKADLMRMYADEEPDSDWAKKYYDYADSLDLLAESLARLGLTPTSRLGLLNLKRLYSTAVEPIKKAAESRAELYKQREALRAKDNTIKFKNTTLALSDFMGDRIGDNSYISGNDVMARVALKAQIAGTNYYNQLINLGYTASRAMQEVDRWSRWKDNPIIKEELANIGEYSLEDQAALFNSISSGMYNAMGKIAEGEYMNAYQRLNLNLLRVQEARLLSQYELGVARQQLAMTEAGYKYNEKTKEYEPDPKSPIWEKDANGNIIGKKKTTRTSSSDRISISQYPIKMQKKNGKWKITVLTETAPEISDTYIYTYGELPEELKELLRNEASDKLGGDPSKINEEEIQSMLQAYDYYYNEDEEVFHRIPRNTKIISNESLQSNNGGGTGGEDDIPRKSK